MGLMQRVNDIITANLHEMVDRFENPEAMLRQAIREIEAETGALLSRASDVLAAERLITAQAAARSREAERWQQFAAAALAADQESQARDALRQKHECLHLVGVLQDEQQTLREAGEKLRKRLTRLRTKLAEARRIDIVHRARAGVATHWRSGERGYEHPGRGWARLESVQFKADRAAARAEAYDELLADPLGEALEIERDRARETAIHADLAELRRNATTPE